MLLGELLVRGDSTQLANPSNCLQHSHKTKQESEIKYNNNLCAYIHALVCVCAKRHTRLNNHLKTLF